MDNSNKKDKKLDLHKVEEPTVAYNSEKTYSKIEDHPLFSKVIEKSKKDAAEGKGSSTEEVMNRIKEKYPFLK